MSIPQLWADLEVWLSIHCKELDGAFRPGASPNKIEAVERMLGVTFPDDVRQFYLCHDGQRDMTPNLFNGFQFLPLDMVASDWSFWQELDADQNHYELDYIPVPEIKPIWWSSKWVPFAANGAGDYQCIDLDPNQAGKSGQIITMWHCETSRCLEASSLTEWFDTFVKRVLNHEFHHIEESAYFTEKEIDP
jgi:cell wall assembly regulator SMI1